jgi:plasmid stability protein
MASLQVRDLDDRLYEQLKRLSRQHRRSISQEVIHIIEQYVSNPDAEYENRTDEFLKLAGAWEDSRSAADLVADTRRARTSNRRFNSNNGLFDRH